MDPSTSNLIQHSSPSQANDNIHKYLDAVCQIDIPYPGTGFLIRPHLVLTCCHVLPKEEVAENAYARFGGTNPLLIKLATNDFFFNNSYSTNAEGKKVFDATHLDFALIALKTTAEHISHVFELSDRFSPQRKEQVHIIQHPVTEVIKKDPDTKRVIQAIEHTGEQRTASGHILRFDQYLIHHNIPVGHGSSGAPIVNNEGHLYAFHQGDCEEHSNCYIGVRTSAVFRYLEGCHISLDDGRSLQRHLHAFYTSTEDDVSLFEMLKRRGKSQVSLAETKVPIELLYTDLELKQKFSLEEGHPPNRQPSSLSIPSSNPSTNRVSLKDLFQLEAFKRKSKRRVIFWGTAGMGKSTLCRHIASEWAKGGLWQDIYQWLFVIPFRHLNAQRYPEVQVYKIADILAKEGECDVKIIRDLLQTKHFKEHTLIIFDGYDERVSNHLSEIFKECQKTFPHILLTSKPQPVDFDENCAEIEISAYSENNKRAYIHQFFKQFQSSQEADVSEKVEKLIERLSDPALASLCCLPMNLTLICTLFNEDPFFLDKFGSIAVSHLYEHIIGWLYRWYLMNPLTKQDKNIRSCSSLGIEADDRIESLSNALQETAWYAIEAGEHELSLNHTVLPTFKKAHLNGEHVLESGLLQITTLSSRLQTKHRDYQDNSVVFVHSTFQEYLAASYLASYYLEGRQEQIKQHILFQAESENSKQQQAR